MYKDELDYMNAIGCLLVILIHVLSIGIVTFDPASWRAAVIYFPHRFSAFVVPMFLYTGAVKMALQFGGYSIRNMDYIQYCLGRIKKIFIPYIIANVVYYLYFKKINYVVGGVKEFFLYLFVGNLSAPFYYVIIVMQFYFLMPVWMKLLQSFSAHIAIIVGVIITFCAQRFGYALPFASIRFPYMFSYILYWIIGLYVGSAYCKKYSFAPRQFDMIACIGIVVFSGILSYLQYAKGVTFFDMNNIKLLSDICSIMLLHYLSVSILNASNNLKIFLKRIYHSSFFVYLSHCLFLVMSERYYVRIGINKMSLILIIRFLTCYTLPFFTFYVWRKTSKRVKMILEKS